MGNTHTVRFEPVGIEIEVDEEETILNAAFRQGIMLMHGCKEGQCSACKSFILDGEVDLDRYSTFALPDFEEAEGWTLLCRAHPYSDLEIELINYDEEIIHGGMPPRTVSTVVETVEPLTSDIWSLKLKPAEPLEFKPGQYVDITIPGTEHHRSFSMANTNPDTLEFMIKHYEGGKFSGLLSDGSIKPGDALDVTGPYGVFTLRPSSPRRLLFIGGGAGMAPILSLLRALRENGSEREKAYYYGARTEADLFQRRGARRPGLRLRPRPLRGQQRLEGRERADHRCRRAPRGRHRRGRRLRVRPAADGRGDDRAAGGQGRARGAHLFRQVHHHSGRVRRPMATEVKERSVPKPTFTDAEAGPRSSRPGRAAATTTSSRASVARRSMRTSRSTSSRTPSAT